MADVTGLLMMPKGKSKGPLDDLGDEPEATEEEPSMGKAKLMAAEDALDAFKSGDAQALSDALTRHYEACAGEV